MTTANDVLKVASAQVGYREGRSGGHWNNYQKFSPAVPGLEWSQNQAWCHTFVSWVFRQAGGASLAPVTASCAAGVEWFRARGAFSEYPRVGAVVYFGAGGGSHVGIVERFDDTYIYTIEGNTNAGGSAEGDGVYRKVRVRRDAYVFGYGYPRYSTVGTAVHKAATVVRESVKPWVWFIQGDGAKTPNSVRKVQEALKKEFPVANFRGEKIFGKYSKQAYRWWQQKLGYRGDDADGVPGVVSLTKLGEKHGFTVKGGPAVPATPGKLRHDQVTFNKTSGRSGRAFAEETIRAGLALMGLPVTRAWIDGYLTMAVRESSYNPNAANGWDSNAIGAKQSDGYPFQSSRGMWQCIPQTFAAYHQAGTSTSIYDPIASFCASVNYVRSVYGVRSDGSNLAARVQQADPNRGAKGY